MWAHIFCGQSDVLGTMKSKTGNKFTMNLIIGLVQIVKIVTTISEIALCIVLVM